MLKRIVSLSAISVVVAATSVSAQVNEGTLRKRVSPTVAAVRAMYPAKVTDAQVGEILNRIAWTHRDELKLLKKTGGGKCPSPVGGTTSCDIIIWAPPGTPDSQTLHVDVLNGASGDGLLTASPFWNAHGPCTKRPAGHPDGGSACDMRNALAPVAPVGDPTIPPPPPPPPPTGELAAMRASLAELQTALSQLRAHLDERMNAFELQMIPAITGVWQRLEEAKDGLDELRGRPAPTITLPPFEFPVMRCQGNTKPFGGALVLDCEKRN